MTITHEVEREEVMAYRDGELPAARALTVRAHIDQCAECAALADDLRQASADLAEWVVEPAPIELNAPALPAHNGLGGHRTNGLFADLLPWLRLPQSKVARWGLVSTSAVGVIAIVASLAELRRSNVLAPAASRVDVNGSPTGTTDGAIRPPQGPTDLRSLGYASGASQGNGRGGAAKTPTAITDLSSNSSPAYRNFDSFGQTPPQRGGADAQMIVRTASVSVSTEKFDEMRAALERIATDRHGSVAGLTVAGDPPNHRSMRATLRVPIAEMDAALTGVRALGRVLRESQSSEDITDAHRDLAIRIANSKIEETRLGEILKNRTGRLSDVLAVEQAQSRVRTEIEQMEAQELAMRNRAALSTISVEIDERYRAELADSGPLSIGARLRNAVVDGARAAVESLVGVALGVLGAAPTLVVWAAVLFVPVRWLIRRMRRVRLSSAQ